MTLFPNYGQAVAFLWILNVFHFMYILQINDTSGNLIIGKLFIFFTIVRAIEGI